jgi:glyoxylase-like metal-dependent hydrolase (beta-lactamase superfamily II)
MGAPAIPTESLPLAGGQGGASVRVHPLRTGTSLAPPGFFDRPKGPLWKLRGLGLTLPRSRWLRLPFPCFLVEHPGAGPFLLDTGLHASIAGGRGNLGLLRAIVVRLEMDPEDAAPAQIGARDVDVEDVNLIVMTHLHYDHASGASQFPDAKLLVERREWEAAHGRLGFTHGYTRKQLDPGLDWRAIDVAGEADLFGDGSVRAVHTPGHTKGHLSFVLRLQNGRLVVTADAALAQRTLDERLLPLLLDDDDAYRASLDKVIALARDADHVVTGHDPEGLQRHDGVFE